jgi:hypothetical protein
MARLARAILKGTAMLDTRFFAFMKFLVVGVALVLALLAWRALS